jgi:hypothetical protein
MHFATYALAAATLILAAPPPDPSAREISIRDQDINTTTHNIWEPWARFCNDLAGTEGCGMWVEILNPGCLNEDLAVRKSIVFKNEDLDRCLIVSPSSDCPCQNACYDLTNYGIGGWQTWDITGWGSGQMSFRFLDGFCDMNVDGLC